jgi:hypothetical protein
MTKYTVVSAKIPDALFQELALRISEGERSTFIREAIFEKLQKTPRPKKLLELEQKLTNLQKDVNKIRDSLAKLEILTYENEKINPYFFCIDDIDTKIVGYLLDHRGATTTEIAKFLHTNRWLVLNRLRKIGNASKKQLGKPILSYYSVERRGKRKAWWINEDVIEH